MVRRAASRAQASAARTSSSVRSADPRGRLGGIRVDDVRDRVDDVDEADATVVEGVDRDLVGGVVDRRPRAAGLPHPAGERTAGKASSSSGSKSHDCALVQSTGTSASAMRSGQLRPSAIGTSIRGGPACAIVEPSTNSTIEWIICCGCTTTSMRSNGMSKSRCASMTSSPLLTSVAEFVVMTRPIAKFGWASACSGVTSASSARVRPRNGPPLAVTTSRRTSSARPPRRHWAMAECSLSTGTIWPGAASALTSGPADDERLLVGERERGAGAQRGERRLEADGAGDAVDDDVGLAGGERRARVGADEQLGVVCRHAGRVGSAGDRSGQVVVRPARHRDDGHAQRDGLLGDEVEVGAGREPDHLEAVAVALRRGRWPGCRSSRSSRAGRCGGGGAGVSVTPAFSRSRARRSGGHSPRPEELVALEGVGDGPGHAQAVHPDVVGPRPRAAAVVRRPVGLDLVALRPRRP